MCLSRIEWIRNNNPENGIPSCFRERKSLWILYISAGFALHRWRRTLYTYLDVYSWSTVRFVPFGCQGKAQIKKKKSERKCCTLQINLIALTHHNGRREREGERHFSLFFFPRLHCTHTHTAAVFVFFLQDTAKSRICFSSMNRIGRNQLDRVDRASAAAANQETRHHQCGPAVWGRR